MFSNERGDRLGAGDRESGRAGEAGWSLPLYPVTRTGAFAFALGGPNGGGIRIRTRIRGDKGRLEVERNTKDNKRPGGDGGCATKNY